jgi:NADPH:quinone reductase-like Zn-dependent oxidoreductase
MKTIHVHGHGDPHHLCYEEAPQPQPLPGEVLVRVTATAVHAHELTWTETYQTATGVSRPFPIPGHDFAGTVAAVGVGVTNPAIGDAVYAMIALGRDGAEAEYVLAYPSELAPKPRTLDDVQAAAVPLAALTAWQALFSHAGLQAGHTVLIHGATGSVGSYAVQFAHWAGARVIATTGDPDHNCLRDLGADVVIAPPNTGDAEAISKVDVVCDLGGGETLASWWPVVKSGGVVVSPTLPPVCEPAAPTGVRFVGFVVAPNGVHLRAIGALLDTGQVRPLVGQIFPLAAARQAFVAAATGHPHGTIVLQVPG